MRFYNDMLYLYTTRIGVAFLLLIVLAGTACAENIALNKVSWADTTYSGVYPSSKGNDGILLTEWLGADGDITNINYTVDLGAEYTITNVTAMQPQFASFGVNYYNIQSSTDNLTYTIQKGTAVADSTATLARIVSYNSTSYTARYIRLFVVNSTTGTGTGIAELEVEVSSGDGTPACASPSGTCWYVSSGGNNNLNGSRLSTAKKNWSTTWFNSTNIQPGDNIYLINGTWNNESVVFPRSGNSTHPILMTSYNGTPILDGLQNTGYGIQIGGAGNGRDYINVSNITILNYSTNIFIRESTNIHILNITARNSTGPDNNVFFVDSNYSSIQNSTVSDTTWNSVGVQTSGIPTHNITIKNNVIKDSPGTAGGEGHNLIDLNNNSINSYVQDIYILNNRLYNSKPNSAVFQHSGGGVGMERINISNNIANDTYGMQFSHNRNSTVINSTIYNNTYGLLTQLNLLESTTIRNNTEWNNTVPIYLSVASGKTISLINNNFTAYRILNGGANITDSVMDVYTVQMSEGAVVNVNYSTGNVFAENGVNIVSYFADRSIYTLSGNETVSITKYNITIQPSVSNVTAANTTSVLTVNYLNNIIPVLNFSFTSPIPVMNITLNNVTNGANYSLYNSTSGAYITSVVAGSNQTIWFNNSLGNAAYNITETVTSTFIQQLVNISCPAGWCFLAMNRSGMTLSELDSVLSNDRVHLRYNNSSQRYETHQTGYIPNRNSNISQKLGYGVYFTAPASIAINLTANPTIILGAGWNLVGNMNNATNLSSLRTSIGVEATQARHFNLASQSWISSDSETVPAGEAFFVYLTASKAWSG